MYPSLSTFEPRRLTCFTLCTILIRGILLLVVPLKYVHKQPLIADCRATVFEERALDVRDGLQVVLVVVRAVASLARVLALQIRLAVVVVVVRQVQPLFRRLARAVHRNLLHAFLVHIKLTVFALHALPEYPLQQFLAVLANSWSRVRVHDKSVWHSDSSSQLLLDPCWPSLDN